VRSSPKALTWFAVTVLCLTVAVIATAIFARRYYLSFAALRNQVEQIQIVAEYARQGAEGARINSERLLEAALGPQFERHPIVLGPRDSYAQLDNNYGSANDVADRDVVDCSAIMRKKTAVIMVAGQSNGANHGQGSFVPRGHVFNFNFFDGKCYVARDPLLGATGRGASFAIRLADKLVVAELYENVLLVPVAVGGTAIREQIPGSLFFRRFEVAQRRLEDRRIVITHVLWHQGEGENGPGAVAEDYVRKFNALYYSLRTIGIYAPIYVAQTTVCGNQPNEIIRGAQRSLVNPLRGILAGPDSDVIGLDERWDKCHMDEHGVERHAQMWFEALRRDEP
jgi:Carbohydrate esterase, sialic acid-specific acetylesterase